MASKELTASVKEMTDDKETLAAAVAFVKSLPDKMKALKLESVRIRESAQAFTTTKSPATETPDTILSELNKFWEEAYDLHQKSQALQLLLHTRYPDVKSEDNDGVAVQQTVMEYNNTLRTMVLSDGSTGYDAVRRHRYLKERAMLEGKILGDKDDSKDKEKASVSGGSKAPSYALAVWALDVECLENLSIAYLRLHDALLIIFTGYAKNQKKILNPRESDARFVH